jgi:choline-sulfatase
MYVFCSLDPEQLFDLDKDPNELDNLIENTDYKSTIQSFRDTIGSTWNLDRFDQDVRESQAKRKVVYEALRKGGYYPWDFQPLKQASERYMRNHMDLNILESSQRYPSND